MRNVLALMLLMAGVAGAQETGVATIQARSTLVLVPTTVRTKAGAPVFTLKADDFNVTDDGVSQVVRLEEDAGALPLALVVVIEAGGDGAGKLDQYRGLGTMVEQIAGGVPHKVALVAFDSEAALVQPFTEDLGKVNKAIFDVGPGDNKAAVLDALAFSVDLLKKQPVGYRRAILLVSETVDHGSHTSLEEAVRAVSDTNTVVYSLGFSSTRGEAKHEAAQTFAQIDGASIAGNVPGPAGGCMANDENAGHGTQKGKAGRAFDCVALLAPPLRLAKAALIAALGGLRTNVPETTAKLTGGEYFHFENAKALEKGLESISNRMPNRYFLSFQPQQPHAGLHAVEVVLKEPREGVVVEARKSYWAEGTPAAQ